MYQARAGSSVAVMSELRSGPSSRLTGETVLYHEYAHHFMRAGLTGRAGQHLVPELLYAAKVPIRMLLEFDGGYRKDRVGYDSFYAQSWMLFHYLQMGRERAGQLAKYQQLMATGSSALAAAESVFGDLRKLEKDTVSYVKRDRLSAMVVTGAALDTGSIVVRELRPGEAAMMATTIESKWGVSRDEALARRPCGSRVRCRQRRCSDRCRRFRPRHRSEADHSLRWPHASDD